jgi:hypothetical protein
MDEQISKNESECARLSGAIAGKIDAPETAIIGQTIVVKTVDENGKPTEWEAVNMPSGDSSGGSDSSDTATGIFTHRCGVLLLDILRAANYETDMSETINELEDALVLTITDGLVWVAATTEADGTMSFVGRISNGVPNRLCCVSYNGDFVAGTITDALEENMPNYYRGDLFLAKIPDGSVLLKVPDFGVSGIQVAPSIFSADGTRLADPGYGTKTIDLTAYPDAVYYSCNIKNGLSVEVWQTISENIKSFEFE